MTRDQHAQWVKANCPHRLPGNTDYNTAMVTAGNVYKIHQNPLAALEIITRNRPDSIIASVPSLPAYVAHATGSEVRNSY